MFFKKAHHSIRQRFGIFWRHEIARLFMQNDIRQTAHIRRHNRPLETIRDLHNATLRRRFIGQNHQIAGRKILLHFLIGNVSIVDGEELLYLILRD